MSQRPIESRGCSIALITPKHQKGLQLGSIYLLERQVWLSLPSMCVYLLSVRIYSTQLVTNVPATPSSAPPCSHPSAPPSPQACACHTTTKDSSLHSHRPAGPASDIEEGKGTERGRRTREQEEKKRRKGKRERKSSTFP